jgi:multidrug efflux pump subunit AcrA (membrane-fusion protein)
MNKKFLTFVPFVFLALAPFVFVSCGSEPPAVKKVFSTAVSTSGTLDSFDRVTVAVRGENLAPLSFKTPGRISEIFVRAGDTVEPGQILARLDSAEGAISEKGYASVASNLASVEAAMKTLSVLREETARADAANASVRVKLAEKDWELARKNLENTRSFLSGSSVSASDRISQAETALSAAKSELENTKSLLSERETALKEGALSAMAGAFVVARSGRDFSDAILGVTEANKHKNDSFETYL